MWFGNVKSITNTLVRYYSRERAVNVRKINPKVPTQEAYSIAQSLYDVIKQKGPLTIPNTWIQAQACPKTASNWDWNRYGFLGSSYRSSNLRVSWSPNLVGCDGDPEFCLS